jgi:hypothetical protein
MRPGGAGAHCKRPADEIEGLGITALLMPDHAQHVKGMKVRRLGGEQALIKRLGFEQAPRAMQRDGLSQKVRDQVIRHQESGRQRGYLT